MDHEHLIDAKHHSQMVWVATKSATQKEKTYLELATDGQDVPKQI